MLFFDNAKFLCVFLFFFTIKHSVGRQSAISDCGNIMSADRVLYPIGVSIVTAVRVLYPIGVSIVMADRVLYSIGASIVTADRVLSPIAEAL